MARGRDIGNERDRCGRTLYRVRNLAILKIVLRRVFYLRDTLFSLSQFVNSFGTMKGKYIKICILY